VVEFVGNEGVVDESKYEVKVGIDGVDVVFVMLAKSERLIILVGRASQIIL